MGDDNITPWRSVNVDRGFVPGGLGSPYNEEPSWSKDPHNTWESIIVRWSYDAILKQCNITYQDMADVDGITKQAIQTLFTRATQGSQTSSLRIDSILSQIRRERHRALDHDYCRGDVDGLCIGISTSVEDPRAAKAKYLGERERWDEELKELPPFDSDEHEDGGS